ncbi:MAG: flagellar basal body rod protein FlgC [Kiloniellaceae bacterium]
MSSVFSTALSALAAQSKRLEVSASNVANVRSLGLRAGGAEPQPGAFVPHRVALISTAGGGTAAKTVPVSPPSFLAFDPGDPNADADGLVPRPNVSLEREVVTQIEALRAFQANVKVIEAEDERLGTLLDLLS